MSDLGRVGRGTDLWSTPIHRKTGLQGAPTELYRLFGTPWQMIVALERANEYRASLGKGPLEMISARDYARMRVEGDWYRHREILSGDVIVAESELYDPRTKDLLIVGKEKNPAFKAAHDLSRVKGCYYPTDAEVEELQDLASSLFSGDTGVLRVDLNKLNPDPSQYRWDERNHAKMDIAHFLFGDHKWDSNVARNGEASFCFRPEWVKDERPTIRQLRMDGFPIHVGSAGYTDQHQTMYFLESPTTAAKK